jgi:hypothetical protein
MALFKKFLQTEISIIGTKFNMGNIGTSKFTTMTYIWSEPYEKNVT